MSPSVYESPHRFHYDIHGEVTARMLADSLIGIDGLSDAVGRVLTQLSGVRIRGTDVLITSFQVGSLDENVVFRFFFGQGRKGDTAFNKFRAWAGVHPLNMTNLIRTITLGCIGYAAWHYATESGDKAATVHIENSFNAYGKEMNLTQEEFLALLQGSIKDTKDLKRDVIRIVRPDGLANSGTLTMDGDTKSSLDETALKSVPQLADARDASESYKEFVDMTLYFRASDLDRAKTGWAAIAPELSDLRMSVELGPDVNPMAIRTGKEMHADVGVTYKADQFGNKSPKKLFIKKLVIPDQQKTVDAD